MTILVNMVLFAFTTFLIGIVVGFWCGIVYLSGREHAQTERWENELSYKDLWRKKYPEDEKNS